MDKENTGIKSGRTPGIRIRKLCFQELIAELASDGKFFYILDEKGTDIACVTLKPDPVFVIGDHTGLPEEATNYVERFEHETLSLGTISYLASQCLSVLHYELDNK